MKNSDINNIYQLDGKVPVSKAIPFGLQHILAMFVANIAPIIIVSSACGLDTTETARLIQTAMIVAGIGSVIQLHRRSGGRLGRAHFAYGCCRNADVNSRAARF